MTVPAIRRRRTRSGFYSLSGLPATSRSVSASKPGYTTTRNSVVLSGDTRLNLQISRNVTYVLSGLVFEVTATGRLPIEGVSVYCDSCGDPFGHTYAYTDANGLYRFGWTANGATPLIVGKERICTRRQSAGRTGGGLDRGDGERRHSLRHRTRSPVTE